MKYKNKEKYIREKVSTNNTNNTCVCQGGCLCNKFDNDEMSFILSLLDDVKADQKRLYSYNMTLDHAEHKKRYMQRLAVLRRLLPDKKHDNIFKEMIECLDKLDLDLFVLQRDNDDLRQQLKEKT